MENHYKDPSERFNMVCGPTEENEITSDDEEKDPDPSTEPSGEVIKPGGKQEKNPKKMK